jgi:hypothetical protein
MSTMLIILIEMIVDAFLVQIPSHGEVLPHCRLSNAMFFCNSDGWRRVLFTKCACMYVCMFVWI